MAHLDTRHCGQIFRRSRRLYDWRRLPLIAQEFDITKAQHGIIGAASLFGILIGAIGLAGLSDYFGRKAM
jgi:MFS family permease